MNHIWICLPALFIFTEVLCKEMPPPPAQEASKGPDVMRRLLEKTYVTGRGRTGIDPGPPVLLSPYLELHQIYEAKLAARVHADYLLPDMESYAGYLTVDKKYNSNLWFWYFPVMGEPVETTPLIIWLQGGPGASSLYGLFTEIGPFQVTKDNYLEETHFSWAQNHSLLFIDNPVGTGFSFTDDDLGYATDQTTIGKHLYIALQQFLTIFSELRTAPLTIAGESYAGKHIPSLAIQILWNRYNDEPINLYGLAIGNGFMDPLSLQKYSDFVREVGLVDDKVADKMSFIEAAVTESINKSNMKEAYLYFNHLLSVFLDESKLPNLYNYLVDSISLDGAYTEFIERGDVRHALHVGATNFTSIGIVYRKLVPDFMTSAKSWIEELLENYKIMCYNGHLDIIVAYHPSVYTYSAFSYSGSEEYEQAKRKPWFHKEKLVGFYKTAGNFTEVMVRGAGHMVPADRPSAALALISAFTRGISLDNDTGHLVEEQEDRLRRRRLPVQH